MFRSTELINNVSTHLNAIWVLQSGNQSSVCGGQFVLDCSDPGICTSVLEAAPFIQVGLDSIYEGVTKSLMEAWVPQNLEDPLGLSHLPVQTNGYSYCHIQEIIPSNPYVTEFYLLSSNERSSALCQNGLKCFNNNIEIYATLDCSDNFGTVVPLSSTVNSWNDIYHFSLFSTDSGSTKKVWTTYTPSNLLYVKLSTTLGVFQFIFYLMGGILATYIIQLYVRKALAKKKIIFKHAFFIISSFLWAAYIIAQSFRVM